MPCLIIVINHRCNLKCRYCPTLHDPSKISYNIAIIAIDLFLCRQAERYLIKFSGGEPLMDFVLLRNIIIFARNKALRLNKKVRFQITTNGVLLSDTIIDFLEKSKDIELIISLDGDKDTQLRNRISVNKQIDSFDNIISQKDKILSLSDVTINMVIAPNAAITSYDSFLYILRLGFRRFNFLPAYFIYWDREKLKKLTKGFEKIAKFIISNKVNVYVKNIDVLNSTPLFNDGVVVDCNGDIFRNNLFLSRRFSHLRNQLKVGSIKNFSFRGPSVHKSINTNYLIERYTPRRILKSTRGVDQILSDFVNFIKNEAG